MNGTCVGLQADRHGALSVYAPDGLEGLMHGMLHPNQRWLIPELYAAKAADYQRRWPGLTVQLAPCATPSVSVDQHHIQMPQDSQPATGRSARSDG